MANPLRTLQEHGLIGWSTIGYRRAPMQLGMIGLGRMDVDLSEFSGYVEDSGEGRWTIQAAIEQAVPAEVLSAALYTRFRSRQDHTFAERILSAMRKQFGGHQEPPKG